MLHLSQFGRDGRPPTHKQIFVGCLTERRERERERGRERERERETSAMLTSASTYWRPFCRTEMRAPGGMVEPLMLDWCT